MIFEPGPSSFSAPSAECRPTRDVLFHSWPELPDDAESPAALGHLCRCRDCLRVWIALEAAAELAGFVATSELSDQSEDAGLPDVPEAGKAVQRADTSASAAISRA